MCSSPPLAHSTSRLASRVPRVCGPRQFGERTPVRTATWRTGLAVATAPRMTSRTATRVTRPRGIARQFQGEREDDHRHERKAFGFAPPVPRFRGRQQGERQRGNQDAHGIRLSETTMAKFPVEWNKPANTNSLTAVEEINYDRESGATEFPEEEMDNKTQQDSIDN